MPPLHDRDEQALRELGNVHGREVVRHPEAERINVLREIFRSTMAEVLAAAPTRQKLAYTMGIGEGVRDSSSPAIAEWLNRQIPIYERLLARRTEDEHERRREGRTAGSVTVPPKLTRPSFQRAKRGRQIIGAAGKHGLKLFGIGEAEEVQRSEKKEETPAKPEKENGKKEEKKAEKEEKKAA